MTANGLNRRVPGARGPPSRSSFIMPPAAVHLPSFAARQFRGKTEAGPHGDFIHQFDSIAGDLLETSKAQGRSVAPRTKGTEKWTL